MSLKAASLGLNLVAANHVLLLDLWWNPTTEDQAIDRAHRIGQTRPVTVSRLTIKDTVEDKILSLQVYFICFLLCYWINIWSTESIRKELDFLQLFVSFTTHKTSRVYISLKYGLL